MTFIKTWYWRTVSYTHLDVYKRQNIYLQLPLPLRYNILLLPSVNDPVVPIYTNALSHCVSRARFLSLSPSLFQAHMLWKFLNINTKVINFSSSQSRLLLSFPPSSTNNYELVWWSCRPWDITTLKYWGYWEQLNLLPLLALHNIVKWINMYCSL